MAMSVVYGNAFGGIISENRGGVVSSYVPDTLGSTIGLMNSSGTLTDSWAYWPFGEVRTRTGSSATPFTFLGVIGYFKDVLDKLFYVRARHLRVDLARWLTVDPLWPRESAYIYVNCSPTTRIDPNGLGVEKCYIDLEVCQKNANAMQNACTGTVAYLQKEAMKLCKLLPKPLAAICVAEALEKALEGYALCYALAEPIWNDCLLVFVACAGKYGVIVALTIAATVCVTCPVCCGVLAL